MVQQLALSRARGDFPIANATIPDKDGPRCFPLPYELTGGEIFSIDLSLSEWNGFMDRIQTVYIDNYSGTSGVTLTCVTTGQRIQVQAGKARFCAVLVPQGSPQFTLQSADTQTGRIIFINVPIASLENDVIDSGSVVTVLNQILAAVDGIEALVTAGNATGVSILAAVDGLETTLSTIETQTQQPNATSRILTSAASVNETSAKAAAGKLFKVIGKCNAGAAVFLKIYDKASAINFAADTPVFTVQLDPLVNFALDFGGHVFATGIRYAITAAIADTDTTAIAVGDVTALNVEYR